MSKNLKKSILVLFVLMISLVLSAGGAVNAADRISDGVVAAAAADAKASASGETGGMVLKVISYNVAAGQGVENDSKDYVGTKYLQQVVKLMDAEKADLIGMQEVDDNRFTSRFTNQAQFISSRLGMHCYWQPASAVGPFGKINKHGNSVMSKHKFLKTECVKYVSKGKKSDGGASTETRAFTYALVEIKGVKVNFISTHLGFPEYARVGQAKELIGYIKKLKGPVVVVGDFNTTQGSESYKVMTSILSDSYAVAASKGASATSPSEAPKNRIDFVFFSKGDFICEKAYAGGDTFKNASDHRPFFAFLKLKTGADDAAAKTASEGGQEGAGADGDGAKILDLQKSLFKAK
ncbi:MAG TPA: endonuclease/exonuclease/phosphatase family protein [Candidatus Wallbacteria bacterium]|nr:endonuclease/exonuclease/phosphatase family protein [Candidatus Wallbacteria bacterium]